MICDKKVFYENLKPGEFREKIKIPIAYIPLGTLECHGEHMPLGADGLQSKGFFARLAGEVGGVVLPMIFMGPDSKLVTEEETFYGMDVCGDNFKGNMHYENQKLTGSAYYIEKDLFVRLLDSIILQLARAGFKIIVAHGHGPSIQAFNELIPEFENKYKIKCFHCWGDFSDSDEVYYGLQADHGGSNETSIMMALDSDLVDLSKLPDSLDEWPLGIGMGDPRLYASYEYGEKIIERQISRMKKILDLELYEVWKNETD